MNSIGGYFELELRKGESYHPKAIALNSARHCLEYILRARNYNKIYIPHYTCEVIIEPIARLGVNFERYSINEQLEPINLPKLSNGEALLYTNYFGLKQNVVESLSHQYGNKLIVDNAQAFYSPSLPGIDTFYSPRKFFGVPDGGYLYTQKVLGAVLNQDTSYDRMLHHLRRIDEGAEAGYAHFQENDNSLSNETLKSMSKLTQALLGNIDYCNAAQIRRANFNVLHTTLGKMNRFNIELRDNDVPMVYPFWTSDSNLRQKLIKNKIFVATYWPGISERFDTPALEIGLVNEVIPLPIDQRYGHNDIKKILQTIIN